MWIVINNNKNDMKYHDEMYGQKRYGVRMVVLIVLLLLGFIMGVVDGAHARKRIVVTRTSSKDKYDRSISTFNDQGRLLQVEYAMESTKRGPTTVCLCYSDWMVLMTVEIPSSTTTSTSPSVYRVHHGTLMATTGLQGDGRMFAKAILQSFASQSQEEQLYPSVEEIAKAGASFQHELTFMGGARPLGIMSTFVGISDDGTSLECYQTEPGGSIHHPCQICLSGKHSQNSPLFQQINDIYDNNSSYNDILLNLGTTLLNHCQENDHTTTDENNENHKYRLNIYTMKLSKNSRGGVSISCAPKVPLVDLSHVTKKIAESIMSTTKTLNQ